MKNTSGLRERSVRLRQGFVGTSPKPEGRRREPGANAPTKAPSRGGGDPTALMQLMQ